MNTRNIDINRLLAFSDAVVAVAITLLVLPLTDMFGKYHKENLHHLLSSPEFFLSISTFVISFFVIYSYWIDHLELFSNMKAKTISNRVLKANRLWLFFVILIPAATSISTYNQKFGTILYAIVLLLSSLFLHLMRVLILPGVKLYNSASTIILLLCTIILFIFPSIGKYIFFLLFLSSTLKKLLPKIFKY